jgi:hypothetical protein
MRLKVALANSETTAKYAKYFALNARGITEGEANDWLH